MQWKGSRDPGPVVEPRLHVRPAGGGGGRGGCVTPPPAHRHALSSKAVMALFVYPCEALGRSGGVSELISSASCTAGRPTTQGGRPEGPQLQIACRRLLIRHSVRLQARNDGGAAPHRDLHSRLQQSCPGPWQAGRHRGQEGAAKVSGAWGLPPQPPPPSAVALHAAVALPHALLPACRVQRQAPAGQHRLHRRQQRARQHLCGAQFGVGARLSVRPRFGLAPSERGMAGSQM